MTVPLNPTAAYFDQPATEQWDKVHLDTTGDTPGRLWGLVAPADTCLQDGRKGECWTINELYADDPELTFAHQGDTEMADGSVMKTAALSGSGGHADPQLTGQAAMMHYMGNADSRLARGRYFWQFREDGSLHGLAFTGVVWPDKGDALTAAIVNAHPSSMDARWMVQRYNTSKRADGNYNLAGSCLVVQAGLPIARAGSLTEGDKNIAVYATAIVAADTPGDIAKAKALDTKPRDKAVADAAAKYLEVRNAAWDEYQSTVKTAADQRDAALAAVDETANDADVQKERIKADYTDAKQLAREARQQKVDDARTARKEAIAATKPKKSKKEPKAKSTAEKKPAASDNSVKLKAITEKFRKQRAELRATADAKSKATPHGQRTAIRLQLSQQLKQLRAQETQERKALTNNTKGATMANNTITAAFAEGDDVTYNGESASIVSIGKLPDGTEVATLDNDMVVPTADLQPADGGDMPPKDAPMPAAASACSCSNKTAAPAEGDVTAMPMDPMGGGTPEWVAGLQDQLSVIMSMLESQASAAQHAASLAEFDALVAAE